MTDTPSFAVVTGASSGIGLELSRELAGRGFDVLVCAEDDLGAAQRAVEEAGAVAHPVQADLRTEEGVEQLAGAVDALGRPVDAVVLNAGVGVGGPFAQTPLESDLDTVRLNVASVVHLTKRVLPAMVARGSGRLLFTASTASVMPGPYYATYAASKAFVLSFAEAIRHELAGSGVSVTALMPGPTESEFLGRAGMEDTRLGAMDKDDPAVVARDGVAAMLVGADHVVAGSIMNAVQATGKGLPEPVKAAMHAKLTEPGSADKSLADELKPSGEQST